MNAVCCILSNGLGAAKHVQMSKHCKVGVAQLNAVVGDFPGNVKKLLAAYRECLELGADIVITPEMSMLGYPPRDLLDREDFVSRSLQALDYLKGEVGAVPLLVGGVEPQAAAAIGPAWRNVVWWLESGGVRVSVPKMLLPQYDVFDEMRYFSPAEAVTLVEWRGMRVGVTICEDIWQVGEHSSYRYARDPIAELAMLGTDLLLNLSASPYHIGKPQKRRELLAEVAQVSAVPVVYCNAVGGQDELVFDGYSMLALPSAGVVAEAAGFRDDVQVWDLAMEEQPLAAHDDLAEVHAALVLGLRDYVTKSGFSSVCLGLSGGIDSALCAAIAVEALGPHQVFGLTMPSGFSSSGSIDDSLQLAQALGMSCAVVPISSAFDAAKQSLADLFAGKQEDVTEENMQARLRGLFLMAYSNKMGHLLLTTGNKSELAVGYCTIYGDMCGGLAVIADLSKTRVYQLARWINREREIIPWNTIEKPPSAELRPDQKDQDTLPEYDVLDAVLERIIEQQQAPETVIEAGFDEAMVRWVQRRIDMNEWKRRQAAPGLRVTPKAFGVGRRVPLAQAFRR